ncbi:MAG: cupin domain-containing protein [Oligoflexia bacterium]|nr:cupin domain-containing protein [Oligoflexia bacterium]
MRIIRWRADRKPTQDEVLSMMQDEGLECTLETVDPNTEIKEHKHPFDEVRIVVKGAMRYNVAGNEFILREGDRLELPSNTRHWTRAEALGECVSIYAFRVN